MAHGFPGFAALRRAFTNATAAAFSLGASIDCASQPYSREMDSHARLKTRRIASAGVGTVGFMGQIFRVVHGSHFSPVELLNTTHQFGEAL